MTGPQAFLLQRVQPAMVGLIDGSLSTLAPIFSIALATHNTRYAFIAGLAIGLVIGYLIAEVRRRLDNPPLEITIAIMTGYFAFIPGSPSGAVAPTARGLG